MNALVATLRLFTFVMLGIVAMGDDVEPLNMLKNGDLAEFNQNQPLREEAKGNLRAVASSEATESVFSKWMRGLRASCGQAKDKCPSYTTAGQCKANNYVCRWNGSKKTCVKRTACELVQPKVCISRRDCSYNSSTGKCTRN